MLSEIWTRLREPLLYPVQQTERVYWLYLFSALIAAYIVYLVRKSQGKVPTGESLVAFLFPRRIFLHRSSLVDYQFFYVNTIIQGLVLTPLFVGVGAGTMLLVQDWLLTIAPAVGGVLPGSHPAVMLTFTLLLILAMDFALFYTHYLAHKVPWLWEFHKVHHSAEVLNPLTVYRMHPVDNLFAIGASSLTAGAVNGLYQFLCAGQGMIYNLLGANIVLILFYLFAYNLRHSHIWLDYGPMWSRILISPAQHQIHHSKEQRHWDKNMGFIFAFWDHWWKTLYVPKGEEQFRQGIADEEQKDFETVFQLYVIPFRNVMRSLRTTTRVRAQNVAAVLGVAVLAGSSFALSQQNSGELPPVTAPVYLEDLTWEEVRDALAAGKTTAIVPTGGTEQNGPHMILGKHNYIVRYTAGRIAQDLGNALVAPVLSYVPEGAPEPADGHMRFAGTISVPEPVFESVLEHTARSLKAHGFTLICLLGDSGGNQAAQARVAERLNAEWSAAGVRVLHLGDYYSANGQLVQLHNRGLDAAAIGGHAGVRDTSELLAAYPAGIRKDKLQDNRHSDFSTTGADGNPRLANANTGAFLLELKILAALRQIGSSARVANAQP